MLRMKVQICIFNSLEIKSSKVYLIKIKLKHIYMMLIKIKSKLQNMINNKKRFFQLLMYNNINIISIIIKKMKCSHRLSPNKMLSTHKMSCIIIWIRFRKVSNRILLISTIKVMLNCRNNSTWLKNRSWPKWRRLLNSRQQHKQMISISIYCNSNSNNIIKNKKQKHQGKDLQLDHLVVVSM